MWGAVCFLLHELFAAGSDMTEITNDHVEWAVVGRLRLMLMEPPHKTFNVTHTYALFAAILCWVMQRIRNAQNKNDQFAADILKKLFNQRIAEKPWSIQGLGRVAYLGLHSVHVPAPVNFDEHTVGRLLINLRDATAHGDARNVEPFHVEKRNSGERLLAGFTFHCSEKDRKNRRRIAWQGQITLLEDDLRRIGCHLAKTYCDAMRHSEAHRRDGYFGKDAANSVREIAA
jgi:hypothetical protein